MLRQTKQTVGAGGKMAARLGVLLCSGSVIHSSKLVTDADINRQPRRHVVHKLKRYTCRLTAKNRDQLRNPTLGSRVWATFTIQYNTKFVKRRVAVASEALANRSVKKHRRRRTNVL